MSRDVMNSIVKLKSKNSLTAEYQKELFKLDKFDKHAKICSATIKNFHLIDSAIAIVVHILKNY